MRRHKAAISLYSWSLWPGIHQNTTSKRLDITMYKPFLYHVNFNPINHWLLLAGSKDTLEELCSIEVVWLSLLEIGGKWEVAFLCQPLGRAF